MKRGVRTGRQLGRGWWSGSAIKNREAQKIAFHITAVAETVLFCFIFSLSLCLGMKGKCASWEQPSPSSSTE